MDNLNLLDGFCIPRMYVPTSYSQMKVPEVLIFSDASEKAVGAAAYLKTTDDLGQQQLGFIMGKSKLAPSAGNSISRLELCGAVLATEIGQFLAEQLEILPNKMKYFVYSNVVLGYIKNDTRRFYTYVSNRVARIPHATSPEQWNYVTTHLNPADVATRDVSQDILTAIQIWLKGPEYILNGMETSKEEPEMFPLIEPDSDKEIRPVSPIKYVRDGNLAVKSILLKDNSTVAKVCLFDKLAENEYAEGNNLQITAVYPKKYLGVDQLTATAVSKCQFLSDQNFPEMIEED
ncbi:uncharacterized protein LOC133179633 [Saccostrea echinata]|uniref:uncharacterized protein LOC133179633 n=1 Tax=Saccostrea echinata TaxID=191078 RepID=UPI002A7EF9E8|nr:uncharacterized protein LOC133179633 [Saccostrea echinata]